MKAHPLGLRTLGAWLPGLSAGQATSASHALGLGHLVLSLPSLFAGQTKRTHDAWVACLCAGQTPAHTWRLGCAKTQLSWDPVGCST